MDAKKQEVINLIKALPKEKQEIYLYELQKKQQDKEQTKSIDAFDKVMRQIINGFKVLGENVEHSHLDFKDNDQDVHPQYFNDERLSIKLKELQQEVEEYEKAKLEDIELKLSESKKGLQKQLLELSKAIEKNKGLISELDAERRKEAEATIKSLRAELKELGRSEKKEIELREKELNKAIKLEDTLNTLKLSLIKYIEKTELDKYLSIESGQNIVVNKDIDKNGRITYKISAPRAGGVAVLNGSTVPQQPSLFMPIEDDNSGNIVFDVSQYNKRTVMLTGNRVIELRSPQPLGLYVLRLEQDNTGSRTVTWFNNITWADGGTTPTLTTTANKADVFGFIYKSNNDIEGFVIGKNV